MWWTQLETQSYMDGIGQGLILYREEDRNFQQDYSVHHTAELDDSEGPIYIGPGAKIDALTFVKGPTVIGKGAVVGRASVVRGAYIGTNVKLGYAVEVKNAIIRANASVGPQSYVADSFVDEGAYLGAQVRTSNHRLDGKTVSVKDTDGTIVDTGMEKLGAYIGRGAHLGVQVVILPGRVVAPDSLFGPKVLIDKNYPKGRYTLVQQLHQEAT